MSSDEEGLSSGTPGLLALERWTNWVPLRGAGANRQVPAVAGLYRVRRTAGESGLDYIGETGRSLRGRLGQLGGAYGPVMPYRDPHTGAPALWALRHRDGCDFEASVTEVPGETPWRKAVETAAITLYRLQSGRSPTANFGRMPPGYRISTGNNKRLVETGRRARGGLDPTVPAVANSAPITGDPWTDPESSGWMSWAWSPWTPILNARAALAGISLYRIRCHGLSGLVYVGQGRVRARLRDHLIKAAKEDHRQARYFTGDIEASWVELADMTELNRLEHENDLIGAHVLAVGRPPTAQFLG
jgi:hypothetical protein